MSYAVAPAQRLQRRGLQPPPLSHHDPNPVRRPVPPARGPVRSGGGDHRRLQRHRPRHGAGLCAARRAPGAGGAQCRHPGPRGHGLPRRGRPGPGHTHRRDRPRCRAGPGREDRAPLRAHRHLDQRRGRGGRGALRRRAAGRAPPRDRGQPARPPARRARGARALSRPGARPAGEHHLARRLAARPMRRPTRPASSACAACPRACAPRSPTCRMCMSAPWRPPSSIRPAWRTTAPTTPAGAWPRRCPWSIRAPWPRPSWSLADSPQPRAVTWLGLGALPGRMAHALAPQGTARALRWLSDLGLRRARARAAHRGQPVSPLAPHRHRRRPAPAHAGPATAGLVALLGVAGLAAGWWLGRRR